MARILIIVGVVFVAAGVLIRLGVPLGQLPGDISIRRGHSSFHFPIMTCLVVSAVLSLIAALFRR